MNVARLRPGVLIAGACGLLLLVFMFAFHWYALKSPLAPEAAVLGRPTSYTGWAALTNIRWLLLLTAVTALALAYFQAVQRTPAIPVVLSVIVTVLGGASALVLIYRVLINTPGNQLDERAGAYLGLLAAIGIAYGGFASLRHEGGADPAAIEIETVKLSAHS